MQLSLSADVVAPVGVGVLVVVVAAVVLVIGLRRKIETEPAPTHDDWTGEHVGDVRSPSTRPTRPVRTVADAVAARQMNTGPFAAVSSSGAMSNRADAPDPVGRGAADVVEGAEAGPDAAAGVPAVDGTCPTSAGDLATREATRGRTVANGTTAPQAGQLWPAAAAGSVAVADPVTVGGTTASRPIAVGGAAPVRPGVTTQARHSRPGDDADRPGSAPNPSGDAGSGVRSWLTGALPWKRPGGSTFPAGTERRANGPASGNSGADHRTGPSDPAVDHESGGADSTPSAELRRPEDGLPGESTPSAAPSEDVGESCPVEHGPHGAPPRSAPTEADGLDAWVASLPGVRPAGDRPVAGAGESRLEDERLGAAESFPGARQPADNRPVNGAAQSLPGARRPVDEQGAYGSLPGARRQADDQQDPSAGGSLPGARGAESLPGARRPVDEQGAYGSLPGARRPADDQQDPSAGGSLPGARRAADERPESGVDGSLPGARRPVDDQREPQSDARRPDERLGTAPAGSLPADGRPVDDRPDPGQGAALPGARRPVDGEPSSTQPVDHRSAAEESEPASAAGSSQSVAAAVAQVLAARAAAQTPDADRRGDARDRLLAVLLDDPLRAVGAAVDLQECQERIDRVAATLQDERDRLGDVLARLARSGLRPDQLARLSGLSDAEVAELLRRGLGG